MASFSSVTDTACQLAVLEPDRLLHGAWFNYSPGLFRHYAVKETYLPRFLIPTSFERAAWASEDADARVWLALKTTNALSLALVLLVAGAGLS
jgi:hypothetical protein